MKIRLALAAAFTTGLVGACASSPPPPPPNGPPWGPPAPSSAPSVTWTPPSSPNPSACGAAPAAPVGKKPPVCENYTLKSGQSFHDQLAVQLSSGAFATMDCPRMRLHGQDTPICVTKEVGGHTRGACCPPGHDDPTDPACTTEGFLDQMFSRARVWEWCKKGELPTNPCEPCVWTSNAQR